MNRFLFRAVWAGISLTICSMATSATTGPLHSYTRWKHEAKTSGPLVGDSEFFASLDLDLPGLQAVKTAIVAGDVDGAKSALCDYYRQRTTPKYFPSPAVSADPKLLSRAEEVLQNTFHGQAVDPYPKVPMGDRIDWTLDPVKDREWTWSLNRHQFWVTLAHAYLASGDEKYAKCFGEQIADWVLNCPVPPKSMGAETPTWRTIEAGIRMFSNWPQAYSVFVKSPSWSVDSRILFYKSLLEHARFLRANPTGGNWLTMEMDGLAHVGILFPEFKEAAEWRGYALQRLAGELNRQVYPDGAQFELTTSYHNVALMNFVIPYKLAGLNDVTVAPEYRRDLGRMFEFNLKLAKPNCGLPCFNDSDPYLENREQTLARMLCDLDDKARPIRSSLLAEGADILSRGDMHYVATGGQRGEVPGFGSCALPYAGMFVMRSGWDKDARYLAFDAGPFGAGHQHEDKLGFELAAYDRTFIVDPGRYSYAGSEYRSYFLGADSHSTIRIDGLGQNRRAKGAKHPKVVEEPMPHTWVSTQFLDYAEGVYDEGYGPSRELPEVTHRRGIVFVKPDFWVIADSVEGTGEHQVESLFHFTPGRMARGEQGNEVIAGGGDDPSLRLGAFSQSGRVGLSVVEGQTSPVLGWVAIGYGKKVPAPTAILSARAVLPISMSCALVPAPVGQTPERAEPIEISTTTKANGLKPTCLTVGDTDVMVDLAGTGRDKSWGSIVTDARVVCVRRENGEPVRLSIVGGSRMMSGEEFRLDLRHDTSTGTCEIELGPEVVSVQCAVGARLQIPLSRQKAIVVNGVKHELRKPRQHRVFVEGESVRTE